MGLDRGEEEYKYIALAVPGIETEAGTLQTS